ncbi:MAG: YbaB/EbfC family nucleoid-associated protein [Spirochaetales bacterium]|nr:YbaB/EbfC family nucleoid-associated protein [Spirochaetales bacterium]
MNLNDVMKMFGDPRQMEEMARQMRAKMLALEVEGSAGGGMVKVVLDGDFGMKSVAISPEVVDPSDVPMLNDLVRAAYNDAVGRLRERMQSEFGAGAQGAGIPGLGGLFGGGGR